MATIGTFKKTCNEYTGAITTLSVQAKGVRIVPEDTRSNDNAPSHRVFVGKADYAERGVMRSRSDRAQIPQQLIAFPRLHKVGPMSAVVRLPLRSK